MTDPLTSDTDGSTDAPAAPGRVLVTGGAGFIGSTLVRSLTAHGIGVRVVDSLRTGRRAYLPADIELVESDIADVATLTDSADGCDAIVHLAAHASVPASIDDPLFDFRENVVGTINVLEAARHSTARRVVLASSNATTGAAGAVARPDGRLAPVSPYGAGKAAGELYGSAYGAAYGLEVVALRFSNVYGPWSLHKSSVVAAFIKNAIAEQPLIIHGDGEQTRDFVFVEDLVAGILLALSRPLGPMQVLQIGSGVETSINALADIVEATLGSNGRRYAPARAGDVLRNVSDISRTRESFGFHPATTLKTGIGRTAEWWRVAVRDHDYGPVEGLSSSD